MATILPQRARTPEIRIMGRTSLAPITRIRRRSLAHDGPLLRPLLVSNDYFHALAAFKPLVGRPVAGLEVRTVYLVDAPASVTFVTHGELDELGIDVERLHALALGNLPTPDLLAAVRRACAGEGHVRLRTIDAYVAARLLLVPGLLLKGEELGAVVTDRDTVVLARPTSEGDWQRLDALAAVPRTDRLILDRPVLVTHGGLSMRPTQE